MGLILDSSVLISAERDALDWIRWQETLLSEPQFISAITLSELWHGCHRAQTEDQRMKRERFIRGIEARFPVLGVGVTEARIHARLWSEMSTEGRSIGAHDLWIAATALAHDYALATLNSREFSRVPGLRLAEMKSFLRKS